MEQNDASHWMLPWEIKKQNNYDSASSVTFLSEIKSTTSWIYNLWQFPCQTQQQNT